MSLSSEYRKQLLSVARDSIQVGVKTGHALKLDLKTYPEELLIHRATFVTLEEHHLLRGCIGMLEAIRPLVEDVAENAFLAAFRDYRFEPVTEDEIADLEIHISILSPVETVDFDSEQSLLMQLRPGIDGLILLEGSRKGTFLPSVWESLPDPDQFLRNLKQKAGLPADYWSEAIKVLRYETEMFKSTDS